MNTIPNAISNTADVIDSREVVERIAHLKASWADATGDDPEDYTLSADDWLAGLSEEERDELVALLALQEEGESITDWEYGATLIHEYYFRDYARELAEEVGGIPTEYTWPASHIDWDDATEALRMDYISVDFNGATYWVRG